MAGTQVKNSDAIAVTTGTQLTKATAGNSIPGFLHLVQVAALGAATGTITVYDSNQTTGAPSGKSLLEITVPTTWTDRYDYGGSMPFYNGLYVVVAGTGAVGHVTWE